LELTNVGKKEKDKEKEKEKDKEKDKDKDKKKKSFVGTLKLYNKKKHADDVEKNKSDSTVPPSKHHEDVRPKTSLSPASARNMRPRIFQK
jgi:hypothetical protein